MNIAYAPPAGGDGDCPDGIMIQGIHFALGGQPPRAQTKGWGNLSFLYQRNSPN
jgi:hypothetical protein